MKSLEHVNSILSKVSTSHKAGSGFATSHHGEILQGIFEDDAGSNVYGLVTLPRFDMVSSATFSYSQATKISVDPPHKQKALKAAKLTLEHFGINPTAGSLEITTNIEEELGMGSSSSDVVATILSVANAFNKVLSSHEIAQLAVSAEQASDPIMYYGSTVLFAQTEGRVLEIIGPLMPDMMIVSFICGENVKTTEYQRPNYTWRDVMSYKPLLGLLRHALHRECVGDIGKVATQSSILNQRFLPKNNFDRLLDLVESVNAEGIQVAHSGNLVGIIIDYADKQLEEKIFDLRQYLAEIGIKQSNMFMSTNRGRYESKQILQCSR